MCAGLLVFGCQPPWAGGALLGAILLLGGAYLAATAWAGANSIPLPRALAVGAVVLVAWLCVVAAVHAHASDGAPAFGVRCLSFAASYLAAALLGAHVGASRAGVRFALHGAFIAGVLLATLGLLRWLGHGVTEGLDYGNRLTAFTNPNRFAVALAVCCACGAGALCETWATPWAAYRRTRLIVLGAALLFATACVGLTLSRLTLLAAAFSAVLLSVAWLRLRSGGLPSDPYADPFVRLFWRALPFLTLLVALGVCFAVGQHALRERARSLVEVDASSRWTAWAAVWPLLLENPVRGLGPGMFESRFTAVQPFDLQGRWRELHSDWLQLGVETGLVTLGLALLCAALWARQVWRAARREHREDPAVAWQRLLVAAGVLVALACSLADFPLREPATAVLVFFLAGMLSRRWPTDDKETAPQEATVVAVSGGAWRQIAMRAALGVLAACFLAAAWPSGRNAMAYARSPWMWHLLPPAPAANQVESWRRAAATDPSDPELRFHLARAALQSNRPEDLEEARASVLAALDLNPVEHRYYWLAALVEGRLGDQESASSHGERAVKLAPGNLVLRDWMGRHYVAGVRPDDPDPSRGDAIAKALPHLQIVAREASAAPAIGLLAQHGYMAADISGLWPGDAAASVLRRAELYLAQDQLALADHELAQLQPEEEALRGERQLLLGSLAFRRGDVDAGVAAWQEAFRLLPRRQWARKGPWLVSRLPELGDGTAVKLVDAFQPQISFLPAVAEKLAWAMVRSRDWLPANRLLDKTASLSASLQAAWAEVGLGLSDYMAAESRAAIVRQRGGRDWARWGEDFARRLEAQRKRKP
jgi:O-antigen ligase